MHATHTTAAMANSQITFERRRDWFEEISTVAEE
jgi:hypothetical protein